MIKKIINVIWLMLEILKVRELEVRHQKCKNKSKKIKKFKIKI